MPPFTILREGVSINSRAGGGYDRCPWVLHRLGVHIRDPWTSQMPVIAVFFRECALDVETNEL